MAIDDRVLQVLRAFNNLGPATVLELARATGISRAAIYRILETLCVAGYVRRTSGTASYQMTSLVRALSSGYREPDWIAEAGAQAIARLQEQVRWPTSLSVPEHGDMVVCETTRFKSPFVFDMGVVGMKLPMFRSAMGLAYFAFASKQTQKIIEDLHRDRGEQNSPSAAQLKTIVGQGYSVRVGGLQPKTATIAMPILARDGAIGSICVTYAKSAVAQTQAIREFVPLLRAAASNVTHAYAKLA